MTLHSDFPRTFLMYAFCLNIPSGLCTLSLSLMSRFGQIIWSPFYKPQWVEKQNSQLSFNCSNAAEQVMLITSLQSAKKQFIISSYKHNVLYEYIIPLLQSFRVLYEASHFCNICDITPKLLMTFVAERLNDLCKVTHQFRWWQAWKHYVHYNYLTQ